MLRRALTNRGFQQAAVAAGGLAAAAYALHSTVQAAEPDDSIFVINGFYMAMREKYTKPGGGIHYYLVEWDPKELSWDQFRNGVLGATDPVVAADGSLRKEIFSNWKSLKLSGEPNVGDNGVHASASPFEALAERLNWMGARLEDDPFGQAMMSSGISKSKIMEWTKDPQVTIPGENKKASLFDLLEDLDHDKCLEKAQAIAGVDGPRPAGKMRAFVFLKPHAVTEEAKALVKSKLGAAGISVYQEGALGADVIEKDKLIDNHYYAIACKASLSKPSELNPPQKAMDEFERKFGLSWKAALAQGRVFNAVDGCKRLGIDGFAMDKQWAQSKAEKQLVKFGGGFYAGKLPVPKKDERGWAQALVLTLFSLFSQTK